MLFHKLIYFILQMCQCLEPSCITHSVNDLTENSGDFFFTLIFFKFTQLVCFNVTNYFLPSPQFRAVLSYPSQITVKLPQTTNYFGPLPTKY